MTYPKGPWAAYGDKYDKTISICPDNEINNPVAWVDNDDVDPAEASAIARLISNAPDLVETLQELLDSIPSQTNDKDWWPDELTRAVDNAKALLELIEAEYEDEE